ncbi:hypothetical protein Z043_124199 [Scleropages formosus]|uniref:Uncharacterized protein n=1 Tax=Scleropages formosus TaxID=113540 RepID=A0A0P7W5W4_SCLFO|nr:hypothetical protein Z043_124199 [Scleropages formosus]
MTAAPRPRSKKRRKRMVCAARSGCCASDSPSHHHQPDDQAETVPRRCVSRVKGSYGKAVPPHGVFVPETQKRFVPSCSVVTAV